MLDDRCSFKSRYYNPAIGKFIEPDTIVPKAKNPQVLNRYAYALNNPLKLVDPSGHDPRQWLNEQWTSPTLSNEMQPGRPRRMGHAQRISPVTRRMDALTTRSGFAEWG